MSDFGGLEDLGAGGKSSLRAESVVNLITGEQWFLLTPYDELMEKLDAATDSDLIEVETYMSDDGDLGRMHFLRMRFRAAAVTSAREITESIWQSMQHEVRAMAARQQLQAGSIIPIVPPGQMPPGMGGGGHRG